ncbi:MAG TPA: ABC transporter ATP-binding protein [Thermodesulfobacteriota bacterium]
MHDLTIERLTKRYGQVVAVDGIDLAVRHGEFLSLLGPSGCGKTTVLRMVAGLVEPDAGRIALGARDITRTPVHRRNVGLVFQSYALFPHLSVFENIAYGLRRRGGLAEAEIRRKVDRYLALVRLDGVADRSPRQLSGGQQQRVALARALVTEPAVLLLDEPLSNLDALLREEMRVELKRLQETLQITTIFVTHDQAEALALSDRVAVMCRGRLEQLDTPEAIYHRPASRFVATFLGRSALFEGTVTGREAGQLVVRLADGLEVRAAARGGVEPGDRVDLVLRQEAVRLVPAPTPGAANSVPATVVFVAFAGATSQYVVRLASGTEITVEAPSSRGAPALARGASVHAEWAADDLIVLPAAGRA